MATMTAASDIGGNTDINSSPPLHIPSGQTTQNLLLDPDIRDWVVLPLLVIMIAAGLLRHYIGQLLGAKNRPISPIESRTKSCLMRSSRLRNPACSGFLSRSKWQGRVRYYSGGSSEDGGGYLREDAERSEKEEALEAANNPEADMMNPMSMLEGMKGNMAFMVQNMVMMQGISHFFKGFVLVKVPFPLTKGFKMMFQRGLDLSTLDTSYVSSVSWYFLVMFGLRAFFRLAIGDMPQEQREGVQMQTSLGMSNAPSGPPGQQFNAAKVLRAEADHFEMARYNARSNIEDVERRLLGSRYPKRKVGKKKNAGDDIFGFGGGGGGSKSSRKAKKNN